MARSSPLVPFLSACIVLTCPIALMGQPARTAQPERPAASSYARVCNQTLVIRGPVGPWQQSAPGVRTQRVWVRNQARCPIAQGTIVVKGLTAPENKEEILGLNAEAMNNMRPGEHRTAMVVLKSADWSRVRQVQIHLMDVVFLKPSGPVAGPGGPAAVPGPAPHQPPVVDITKAAARPKTAVGRCKAKRVFTAEAGDWVRNNLIGFIWDPILTPLAALVEVMRTSRIRAYRALVAVRKRRGARTVHPHRFGETSDIAGKDDHPPKKKKKKFLWSICTSKRIFPLLFVLCYKGHVLGPLYFAFGGNDKDVLTLLHFGFLLNPVGRTFKGFMQVGPPGNLVGKDFYGFGQVGLGYNKVGGDLYGFGQISLGYNRVGGNLYGFGQIGPGYNSVGGDLNGFAQMGTGYNRVVGSFRGVFQFGLANSAGNFYGFAQLGLLNSAGRAVSAQLGLYNDADAMYGVKLGGILNRGGRFSGVAVAGLVNLHEQTTGLTVGSILNYSCKVTGVQIALINIGCATRGLQVGLVNYSRTMSGLQLGLINVISKSRLPFMAVMNVGTH